MAAPTIPASQRSASLNKLRTKESATKLTHKNILVAGSQEWPRPKKDVEDSILTKLEEKLKTLPNVFKQTKVLPQVEGDNSLTEKAKVRSQLEIGTSSVFRALEQDALACVLVSGQATPAIAVEHIISLGRERGCPVLCLDQLAPTVAKATESKCHPLAVGFKKLADASQSDFGEIISLVKENIHVTGPQYGSTCVKDIADQDTRENRGGTKIKENRFRPLRAAADVEKEILQELERVFSGVQTVTEGRGKEKKKKKKRKKKKNLKDAFDKSYHPLFEIGKRTVTDILVRGKLQLILISEKISPVLVSEPQSFSLLSVAKEKKCPVLVIPGLDDTMRAICSGCISVLGFKKISCLPENSPKDFVPLIEKCLHAVKNLGGTFLLSSERKTTSQDSSLPKPGPNGNTLSHVKPTESSPQKSFVGEKENAMERDDEDYSYLYILKTDSKAYADMKSNLTTEAESTAKSANFSADFIALSADVKGKHSSQPVAVSSVKDPPKKSSIKGKSQFTALPSPESTAKSASFSADFIALSADVKGKHSSQPVAASSKNGPPEKRIKGQSQFTTLSSSASDPPDISKDPGSVSSISSQKTLSSLIHNPTNFAPDGSAQISSTPESNLSAMPLFSLCRSGASLGGGVDKANSKQTKKSETVPVQEVQKDSMVLGFKELPVSSDAKTKEIDVLTFMDSSKNKKKGVKRKMDADSSFISFKYTEANIKTMTSDPSKKKKKKRRK